MKTMAKIGLIIAFNIILFQILLEIGLKFIMVPAWPTYFLPRHYPNSVIQTTAGPVFAEWITNSQGFHDKEHDFGRSADNVRIVTIGDSFLDGPQQEPLPFHLDTLLKKKHRGTEVINLSRPGIDTNLYYVLFKHGLRSYSPDIIIVFIFEGNDFRVMEHVTPALYDQPVSFFRRYPQASYYGLIFPRSSIFWADIFQRRFVHRWSTFPEHSRWGKPKPVRSLEEISTDITKYIKANSSQVRTFLTDRLSTAELDELTQFGVRIDLLAYMTSFGLKAKFKPKLGIKEHRPEISDVSVAAKQVASVLSFIKRMNDISTKKGVEFYTVLIPTSYVDADCHSLYTRLGAADDPLFVGTRKKQMEALKQGLLEEGIQAVDLRPLLSHEKGLYLKFDTHWNLKGVKRISQVLSNYLLENSDRLKIATGKP